MRRAIERRRVARHGRDNTATAAVYHSAGNDDADLQENTVSRSARENLPAAIVELATVQDEAAGASRLEQALIDEPASARRRHGHDRRRRDDQAGRRAGCIDDTANLIDELNGIGYAELSGSIDVIIEIGDDFGPGVA